MEFTGALKKALELGFTKQDFLRVWKANNMIKLNADPQEDLSDFSSQLSRNHVSDDPDTRGNDVSYTVTQHAKEEIREDLLMKLEQLFTKQMEKQNLKWELMHRKNNQMAEDFKRYFDILSKHVSNTVENQGNSLKLNLMQEFDLLRQNFAQTLDEYNFKHVSESKASSISQDQAQMVYEQNTNAQQNLVFGDVKEGFTNSGVIPEQNYMSQVGAKDEDIIYPVLENNDLQPDPVYDWSMEVPEETSKSLRGQEINDAGGQPKIDSNKPKYVQEFVRSGNLNKTDSAISLDQDRQQPDKHLSPKHGSTEATGFLADFISNKFKQNLQPDGSQSASSGNWNEPRLSAKDKEALKPIIYASIHSSSKPSSKKSRPQKFTITNSDNKLRLEKFTITNSDNKPRLKKVTNSECNKFSTSGTQSWKAEIDVKFDPAQQLKVHVIISRDENDDILEWPLKITGTGDILNEESGMFTQIWQLPEVICQRPLGTEKTEFPAVVCLSTSRGVYPDVKYSDLEYRKYTKNNRLTIQWHVTAKKM